MSLPTFLRSERSTDLGLLLVRLLPGIVFIFHGAQKLFGVFGGGGLEGTGQFFDSIGIPFPATNALLAGATEFIGGLALVTGVGARLAALPLVGTMAVAILTVHSGSFAAQSGGMEYPLTLAFVTAGIALTGPGRYRLPVGLGTATRTAERSNDEIVSPHA